jgi:hypothetical protein
MNLVRSLGQIVLFTISFFLTIVGFTTMSSDNNNWILVPVGAGVLLMAHYFKKYLTEMGL